MTIEYDDENIEIAADALRVQAILAFIGEFQGYLRSEWKWETSGLNADAVEAIRERWYDMKGEYSIGDV